MNRWKSPDYAVFYRVATNKKNLCVLDMLQDAHSFSKIFWDQQPTPGPMQEKVTNSVLFHTGLPWSWASSGLLTLGFSPGMLFQFENPEFTCYKL